MRRWARVYGETETSTPASEHALIERCALPCCGIVAFTASPLAVRYVARDDLRQKFGRRSPLARVVAAAQELEHLLARSLTEKPIGFFLHSWLYGKDELAHAPMEKPTFVSLNLGHERVRQILARTAVGDRDALFCLVDLFVHERAHVTQSRSGKAPGHEADFYETKGRIKGALVRALVENPNNDPFRRFRTITDSVRAFRIACNFPSALDLASKFPERTEVKG